MNTKLILAIFCAIVMSAVPFAGAHLTNPQGSLTSAFWTGDNCRYAGGYDTGNPVFDDYIYPKNKGPGPCPNLNDGVSGTYIIYSTPAIGGDADPSIGPLFGHSCPPSRYCGTGAIMCKEDILRDDTSSGRYCLQLPREQCVFEVGGLGGGLGALIGPPLGPKNDPTDQLLDETTVDNAGAAQGAGLLIPDGTWDDGGIGGACHTTSYANDNFNTPGCSGTSHAEDSASGPNVWIQVSCDFFSEIGNCAPLLRNGGNTLPECIDSITCQITSPATCSPAFVGCGSDGILDAFNLGEGGGSVQFANGEGENTGPLHSLDWLLENWRKDAHWNFFGVRYPNVDVGTGCPADSATAATWVLHGIKVNAGDIAHKALRLAVNTALGADVIKESNGKQSYPNWEHTFAVGGWIDWTPDSNGGGTTDGSHEVKAGLTIGLCKLPLPVGPFANLGTLVETVTDDPTTLAFDPLITCSKTNP